MKHLEGALLASALISLLLWVVFFLQFLSYGEGFIGMVACIVWIFLSHKIWQKICG